METAKVAKTLTGDKLYQQRARRALPLLVRQAQSEEPITYANLAAELRMRNPRNLNYVLGSIGKALKELSENWKEEVPPIQCLVVNKNTGLPGEGVSWFISNLANYKKLSRKQQRQVVDAELAKIYGFRNWLNVLKFFGLKPAEHDFSELSTKASTRHGGGEGPDHKVLKAFMANHPELLGLSVATAPGSEEYAIPSGDTIDVFFDNRGEHVGVEVKPASSDIIDLTRGLYQCIKYQAVLEARQAANGKPQNVRTVLVLGRTLPDELIGLKNVLGVEVIENVRVR